METNIRMISIGVNKIAVTRGSLTSKENVPNEHVVFVGSLFCFRVCLLLELDILVNCIEMVEVDQFSD